MDYYEIGQRIRKYRKALGLSQEQLAEKVDISITHMSHIETGNTKLSLQVLVDISCALGESTDAIIFGKDKQTKESISNDIAILLEDCSLQETSFLKELISNAKVSLRKNIETNNND